MDIRKMGKVIGTLIGIGLLWAAGQYFLYYVCDVSDVFRQKDVQRYRQYRENRRKSYIENHSELTEKVKKAILHGEVIEGMTRDQVIVVLGEPNRVFPKAGSRGISELWRYMGLEYGSMSKNINCDQADLYFENGILILHFIYIVPT